MKNRIKELHKVINEAYGIVESEQYGLPEDVYKQLLADIDKYKEKHGNTITYFVDYDANLHKSTIAEIFESEHPLDTFYEIIDGWDWFEQDEAELDSFIKYHTSLNDDAVEEYRDQIDTMILDNIAFTIDYNHFNETIGVDVYLKGISEEALLSIEPTDETDDEGNQINTVVGVAPCIKKLLKTQGYTAKEFIDFYNKGDSDNKFFNSLKNEIDNSTYNYGEIVFLGQAELLDVAKAIEDGGEIEIPETSVCGITESGNGSGSMLEIKLEKPIKGTIGKDFDIFYKDGYHYNVDEIFGLVYSCWDAKLKINVSV